MEFKGDIKELLTLLRKQNEEIIFLKNRILELERQLGLNSNNSSKPPSSDGLKKKTKKKPRTTSSREKGKRPSGGQKGHKGHTLNAVKTPDHIVKHEVNSCEKCQKDLSGIEARRVIKRQVFDIPEPKIEVTEHQAEQKVCSCGHCTKAVFPIGVKAPVQFGARIMALTVYLSTQQFIPEDRLEEVFQDVFSLSISTATLVNMIRKFSEMVNPIQEAVLEKLKVAPIKHLDESGIRVDEKLNWVHSISNENYTHYRIDPQRGSILEGIKGGTVIHDFWKPYIRIDSAHGLCNAHHIRELRALEEIEKEPWAKKMKQLLQTANQMTIMAEITGPLLKFISDMYDRFIDEGLKFHRLKPTFKKGKRARRPGHNLLLRLLKYKSWALRFLTDPGVPFTNNQAERDIRMIKLKQKISNGFRTEAGAKVFCIIRGFLSTCRKQSYDLFETIIQVINRKPISFSAA